MRWSLIPLVRTLHVQTWLSGEGAQYPACPLLHTRLPGLDQGAPVPEVVYKQLLPLYGFDHRNLGKGYFEERFFVKFGVFPDSAYSPSFLSTGDSQFFFSQHAK